MNVSLGAVSINAPASVLAGIIGSDTTSTLKITQLPSPQATENLATAAAGKTNSVIGAFDINLTKVAADGSSTVIHQLGGSLTVTLKLTDEQKAKITDPATAKLYHFNPDTNTLDDMHAVFDMTAGTVTFTTDHFSTFVIAQQATSNPPTGSENLPGFLLPMGAAAGAILLAALLIIKKRQNSQKA